MRPRRRPSSRSCASRSRTRLRRLRSSTREGRLWTIFKKFKFKTQRKGYLFIFSGVRVLKCLAIFTSFSGPFNALFITLLLFAPPLCACLKRLNQIFTSLICFFMAS
jgi:hypothetical protein